MTTNRPKMDVEHRAKQFMPFDALSGFHEALEAKERQVVPKMELSEDYREELDRKMQEIALRDIVSAVYFYKDEYRKVTGMVSKIETNERYLQIVQTKIPFDDLLDIVKEKSCEDRTKDL